MKVYGEKEKKKERGSLAFPKAAGAQGLDSSCDDFPVQEESEVKQPKVELTTKWNNGAAGTASAC